MIHLTRCLLFPVQHDEGSGPTANLGGEKYLCSGNTLVIYASVASLVVRAAPQSVAKIPLSDFQRVKTVVRPTVAKEKLVYSVDTI
jgi:hypothetical protein